VQALKVWLQSCLMKVDYVLQERIFVINLNHNRILLTYYSKVTIRGKKVFENIEAKDWIRLRDKEAIYHCPLYLYLEKVGERHYF
jgi:hypothetical protein